MAKDGWLSWNGKIIAKPLRVILISCGLSLIAHHEFSVTVNALLYSRVESLGECISIEMCLILFTFDRLHSSELKSIVFNKCFLLYSLQTFSHPKLFYHSLTLSFAKRNVDARPCCVGIYNLIAKYLVLREYLEDV